MRFLVTVPATEATEAGHLDSEQAMLAMSRFNEELVKAGVMLAGEGLKPTSKGARITYDGKKRTVRDGPFTESKELIAGFWLLQAASKAEVVEWMKKAPFDSGATIEIRELYEMTDFPFGAFRDHEERLREQLAARAK